MFIIMNENSVGQRKYVIAHRGNQEGARENSVYAFESAIAVGADMIEFDVRKTIDGVLIAHHDSTLPSGPLIAETSYDDILGEYNDDLNLVPTIFEIAGLALGKIGMCVELKESGYESDVIGIVSPNNSLDHPVVLQSFLDETVTVCRRLYPSIPAGLLLGKENPESLVQTRLSEIMPFSRAKKCDASFIAPHLTLLNFGLLARSKRHDLPVFVWTVNDDKDLIKLLNDDRVSGIITNLPKRAIQLKTDQRAGS